MQCEEGGLDQTPLGERDRIKRSRGEVKSDDLEMGRIIRVEVCTFVLLRLWSGARTRLWDGLVVHNKAVQSYCNRIIDWCVTI